MAESEQVINLIGLRPKLINARTELEKSLTMRRAVRDTGGMPGIGEINDEIRLMGRQNNWEEDKLALALADPKVQSRVGLDISSQRLKRLSNRLYGAEAHYYHPEERLQAHKKLVKLDTGAIFEGEKRYNNDLLI